MIIGKNSCCAAYFAMEEMKTKQLRGQTGPFNTS